MRKKWSADAFFFCFGTSILIETRIKDDENVYKIKVEWQSTGSTNKFLLKERLPGDVLVRKPAITAPVAVSAVPSTKAPPPPPPPSNNKPKIEIHHEEQEPEEQYYEEGGEQEASTPEEQNEEENNEQDDQVRTKVALSY